MSKIKGCKRCKYDKTIYHIDYEKSAQEQMIYFTTDIVCSKCNYNPKSKRKHYYPVYRDYCKIPLDKVTDDMNVDLTKIIHEHNHNKSYGHAYEDYIYDNEHNCIETVLIKRYECDFCGKLSDYRETITICKHIYNNIKHEIDYKKSAQEQKIYYKEIKTCSECNYNNISEVKIAKLDNYPSDMNVDLSKIIHKHNHNKIDYIKDKTKYYKDICIKLTLIIHYKCDFCDKQMNKYTEIKEFKEYKDIYDKTEYRIDYKKSAQEQKIYYTEIKSCSKSKQVIPKHENKIVELNNYPSYINVDLSLIIHEHNHNKIGYTEDKPKFDNNGKCVGFISIMHYKCKFCDKLSDYTEIKDNNDLSCDKINLLADQYKEYSECKKKGTKMCHPSTNIGICPKTGNIFKKISGTICIPGNIRPFCFMPDRYVSGYLCSECNEEFLSY